MGELSGIVRRRPLAGMALAALAVALLLIWSSALSGCGGDAESSRFLESEKRLEGMYEACKTIVLKDGNAESEITLEELESMEQAKVDAVLVRSNGMGMPGTWEGVRMSDVLEKKGVSMPFKELKVEAWDGYVGRLPYDIAVEPRTIFALQENGGPIPEIDGPVRLVVGSQDGFYWIRMMTEIEVLR